MPDPPRQWHDNGCVVAVHLGDVVHPSGDVDSIVLSVPLEAFGVGPDKNDAGSGEP